ncbi:DUF423 domain-containing protein [Camelimonas abortus]|uniref:DUF423 domain-containing protein n=1 Tax=Camelimonas abortus TaxID=1017184 RepID=A0ABV7LBA0_9HYPH
MAERLLLILGAIAGFAGVMAAAAAAHVGGGDNLRVSAQFLLFHAPLLAAAPAIVRSGAVRRGPALLALMLAAFGVALFSGQLALRALADASLFSMAAPTGGTLLMLGWLLLGVSALLPARRAS